MSKRNRMPGLRLKGEVWQIEKRYRNAPGGWLRESTGTSSRREAEAILTRRLAELEGEARKRAEAIYSFEQGAMRHLEEIANKRSASDIALHIDQLLPFIGNLPLAQVHDGTLREFIEHEQKRGLAPKSINNALDVVSAVLNKAARVWRDENGRPWLGQAPARISDLSVKGRQKKPYSLSWAEQDRLVKALPRHLADAVLFGLNTGCREQEICQLSWDWEVEVPVLNTFVFILPESFTKTGVERVVVLNEIAKRVVNSCRDKHESRVFTYKGNPIGKLNSSAWRRAWKSAKLPSNSGIRKGVHNLRHTCARRLRSAGVTLETRKAILGHANGDITTHYSAAELNELIAAVEAIGTRSTAESPNLMVIANKAAGSVGKLSENKKGLTTKIG